MPDWFFYGLYQPSHRTPCVSDKHKPWCESKEEKKHSHPWTWGLLKKYRQIIHLQTAAAFPIEAKMNWHSIGGLYRLNTQSNWWKTEKAERKKRNNEKSFFYYEGWVKYDRFGGGFRPTRLICCICSRTIHNNSCHYFENHSVFLYCCSPEGKGTVIKKQIQHLLCICTSAQTTPWLQTCKHKKGKKKSIIHPKLKIWGQRRSGISARHSEYLSHVS